MNDAHFKNGLLGILARWLKSLDPKNGWSDDVMIGAIFITVGSFYVAVVKELNADIPVVIYLFGVGLAGTTYGLDRSSPRMIGPMIRGLGIGGTVAALLHTTLPTLVPTQKWRIMSGDLTFIGMYVFFFTSLFATMTREFLLTTEAQWAVGVRRRAMMRTVWRIQAGAEKREGQPDHILILLYFAKMAAFVLSFVAVLVVAHFLHIPITQAIQARLGL